MKNKRILILIGSLKTGGAERMALNTGQAMIEEGMDVYFVLQNNIIELPNRIPKERLIVLNDQPNSGRLAKLYNIVWKYFWTTVKLRPAVVIAFTRFSSLLATISFCRKIIGRFDINPFVLRRRRQLAGSWVVYWPFVKKIVVPSSTMLKALGSMGEMHEKKLMLISNSIDIQLLDKLKIEENPLAAEKPYLAAMGRLSNQKNYPLLLHAYAKSKFRTTHKLLIIGDGGKMESLQALAQELGLTERVTFTGMLKNPFPVIADAHLFINTSNYESFCNVILESLTLGVPVIGTDCEYGPSDMIIDGVNGKLLPIGNEDILVKTLDDIKDGKLDLESYRANATSSVEKFEVNKIKRDWIQLVEDVINGKA